MVARIDQETMQRILQVYFIAGTVNCKESLETVVDEAIAGGITMFQYREKGTGALTDQAKYEQAKRVQELCEQLGVPFLVNDDIELALAIDADGVHIGQEDEPVAVVREKIGDKILGVSVHTVEQALAAAEQGADYFGIGPIFSTSTKEDARAAQGTVLIETLKEMGVSMPIVAIGGITVENTPPIIAAGADGVSVITAISQADSAFKATVALKQAVMQGMKERG